MNLRLDRLVVLQGLAPSGEQAKQLIRDGKIAVDGEIRTKPGLRVETDADLSLRGEPMRYVSRGGYKLEKALEVFQVRPEGNVCLDLGASTGGFTDCLLQHGAMKVYAVDVGHGQLHPTLIAHPCVIDLSGTHGKDLSTRLIPEPVDLVVIDVSFISLGKLIPYLEPLVHASTRMVALIKPQFEAGPDHIGRNGVVKDPRIHARVIRETVETFAANGWKLAGLDFSPVTGPKGNIEFLAFCTRWETDCSDLSDTTIRMIVDNAHARLTKGE